MRNFILPPCQVVTPVAGTIHWAENSKALGIWGKDFPVCPMLMMADGNIRDLTASERALFQRIYGKSEHE